MDLKRSPLLVLIVWLLVGLLSACASAAPETPPAEPTPTPSTVETKGIDYANVDNLNTKLDVHSPNQSGSWPVVIVVHGNLQNRHKFTSFAQAVASQGAVVYNIDVAHKFPISLSIQRIACAVHFARATAADYGGAPDRITVVGSSRGASTGVVAALAGEEIAGDCLVTDGTARVDAFLGFEGSYDVATTAYPGLDHTHLKDEDPELWHAINPYSQIGLNPDLQIRLVHGEDVDTNWWDLAPSISKELYQALAEAGYDVELTMIEGADHTALTAAYLDGFDEVVELVLETARGASQ